MKTIFEEKFDDGYAVGEARGKVLAILQTRFRRVPKDVEKTIRSLTDLTGWNRGRNSPQRASR